MLRYRRPLRRPLQQRPRPQSRPPYGVQRRPVLALAALRSAALGLAVLGLAALMLTGCAFNAGLPGLPVGEGDEPASGNGGAVVRGPVPTGLERFYSQSLPWNDCLEYANTSLTAAAFANPELECTRVEVPLDYDAPAGGTAQIGVLRRPAEGPEPRVGSLLINPGGPGASGMSTVASLSGTIAGTEVGRRFDLVGFDPRGIGASEPQIRCRTTEEMDADRLDVNVDTSPEGIAQTEADKQEFARRCAARVGTDVLANMGTRDVARDMDILRAVLGDEKLTYLGYSYGTRIGVHYARQFPANVRAMVLDGALDPDEDLVDSVVNQGAGFQQSFDAFVDWCLRTQPDCWLGDTPPDQAASRFQELVRPLIDEPLRVGARRLSYTDATTGTIQALYSDQLWSLLDRGLRELMTGDGSTLLLLADVYYQRDETGYSGSEDAFIAIRCMDDPPVTDQELIREADRRYREVAPFLDDGNPPSAARDACAFWPVPHTSQPEEARIEGLTKVLVLSTTGDPATPHEAGVELARQLGAHLLTFQGNQHTVALQGVSCVDEAVTNYLIRLELPPYSRCFP